MHRIRDNSMNKIEQLKKEYKELAEWSDRMTIAANMMLIGGKMQRLLNYANSLTNGLKDLKRKSTKSTLGKRICWIIRRRWICKLFGHRHNIHPTEMWCSRCRSLYSEFSEPGGPEYYKILRKWFLNENNQKR